MGVFASMKWMIIASLALLIPLEAMAKRDDLTQIHVLADPSLTIPLTLIARDYAREHNVSVSTSFANTQKQIEAIEEGLEADVFITSRASTLRNLKNRGLIDVFSQTSITKNRLSLVTYAANTLDLIMIPRLPLASILERIDQGFSFMLGHPDFQISGIYGVEALRNFEISGELEPYFVFIQSPVEMQHAIAQKGGYGIMLRTDAARNAQLKILGVFPESSHTPISYQAVAVATEQMEKARDFIAYLNGEHAQRIFNNQGFEAIDNGTDDKGHLARGSTERLARSPL